MDSAASKTTLKEELTVVKEANKVDKEVKTESEVNIKTVNKEITVDKNTLDTKTVTTVNEKTSDVQTVITVDDKTVDKETKTALTIDDKTIDNETKTAITVEDKTVVDKDTKTALKIDEKTLHTNTAIMVDKKAETAIIVGDEGIDNEIKTAIKEDKTVDNKTKTASTVNEKTFFTITPITVDQTIHKKAMPAIIVDEKARYKETKTAITVKDKDSKTALKVGKKTLATKTARTVDNKPANKKKVKTAIRVDDWTLDDKVEAIAIVRKENKIGDREKAAAEVVDVKTKVKQIEIQKPDTKAPDEKIKMEVKGTDAVRTDVVKEIKKEKYEKKKNLKLADMLAKKKAKEKVESYVKEFRRFVRDIVKLVRQRAQWVIEEHLQYEELITEDEVDEIDDEVVEADAEVVRIDSEELKRVYEELNMLPGGSTTSGGELQNINADKTNTSLIVNQRDICNVGAGTMQNSRVTSSKTKENFLKQASQNQQDIGNKDLSNVLPATAVNMKIDEHIKREMAVKIDSVDKEIETADAVKVSTVDKEIETADAVKVSTVDKEIETADAVKVSTVDKEIETADVIKVNAVSKEIRTASKGVDSEDVNAEELVLDPKEVAKEFKDKMTKVVERVKDEVNRLLKNDFYVEKSESEESKDTLGEIDDAILEDNVAEAEVECVEVNSESEKYENDCYQMTVIEKDFVHVEKDAKRVKIDLTKDKELSKQPNDSHVNPPSKVTAPAADQRRTTRDRTRRYRKKYETANFLWTHFLATTFFMLVGAFTSCRTVAGLEGAFLYFAGVYSTALTSTKYKDNDNYVRVRPLLIQFVGLFCACASAIVLLEGMFRRPFVFGGEAAIFSCFHWTLVIILVYYLFYSKGFTVLAES